MQTRLQKKVLRAFHYALNPDANLLLGTSESVGDAADLFTLLDRKLKVYAKKSIPAAAVFKLAFAEPAQQDEEGGERPPDHRPALTVAQLADRKVIERYGPPGVIVDEKLDVVQFRGRTGPFLELARGAATLNLLKLARRELLVALRTTLHTALTGGLPASAPAVVMRSEAGPRGVVVDVMPLQDVASQKRLLVLFNEVTAQPGSRSETEDTAQDQTVPRITELEREVVRNKNHERWSMIEEVEATNEELQSSNEELQSSNEELHSANEELETSREELQSTNEELATVNDELHNRMAQLSVANDDLHNVLMNSSASTVIVGPDLRIRRFSTAAEKLLSLIPGDVGRPIASLRNVISARDIEQIADEVIASIAVHEQRVRCTDGSWYRMKMVPYVTADHVVRGVVLEFTKTVPPAGIHGDEVHPLARAVLSTLPQAIMLVDRRLHLVWANRSFFEAFAVSPGSLGRPIAEAWGSTTEPAELWAFLHELVSGRPARDVLLEHPFGRAAERPTRFSGKAVASEGDRSSLAAVFMQDV